MFVKLGSIVNVQMWSRNSERHRTLQAEGENLGHYIELDFLLGGFVDNPVLIFDIRLQQSSVQIREQAQHRISNISQWMDAVLLFMAIYTDEHFPTELAPTLKYVQLLV